MKLSDADRFYIEKNPDAPAADLIAGMGRKATPKLAAEVERLRAEALAARDAKARRAEMIVPSVGGRTEVVAMTAAASERKAAPAPAVPPEVDGVFHVGSIFGPPKARRGS